MYLRSSSIHPLYRTVNKSANDFFCSVFYLEGKPLHIQAMSEADVVTTRRLRLKSIIDKRFGGKQSRFVEEFDINAGELSGLLRSKHFGEKKARSLEAMLGLPEFWMDGLADENSLEVNEPRAEYSVNADLTVAWNLLLPDEQAALLADIKSRAAHNKAVMDMLAAKPNPAQTETQGNTVRASDRRQKTKWFGMTERRDGKENKNG